ncbi:MAG: acyl-CoA dehydrogenase family protein [Thermodesulfobacteriota bacterium]|nr:acyl-CoA dehydrogenase family protein [Thermodesulfobacteriota bacterium]
MGDLGFYGCPIPEEYGGSGLGFLAHAVVTEEISKVSGSLRAAFNMQTMGTAREIFQFGNEEQKRKYIAKLVSGEYLGCIGITEPNAGSDVGGIKTKAVREWGCLRPERLKELDHLRPGGRFGDHLCLHGSCGQV